MTLLRISEPLLSRKLVHWRLAIAEPYRVLGLSHNPCIERFTKRSPPSLSSDVKSLKACILICEAHILILEYRDGLTIPLVLLSSKCHPILLVLTTNVGPLDLGIVIRLLEGRIGAFASLTFPSKGRYETAHVAMESNYQNFHESSGVIPAMLYCHQLC